MKPRKTIRSRFPSLEGLTLKQIEHRIWFRKHELARLIRLKAKLEAKLEAKT